MTRLRFVQDDDTHWYAIPADKLGAFRRWVQSFEDDAEGDYSEGDFDTCHIDGGPFNYTFIDLQEDK